MAGTEMFKGASPLIFARAEYLRERMTHAEKILWEELRGKKLKFKFRRQHPMAGYIADFYCHKLRLVIELDGEIHLKKEVHENDLEREKTIRNMGITVIRFRNDEVLNSLDCVLHRILKIADSFEEGNID